MDAVGVATKGLPSPDPAVTGGRAATELGVGPEAAGAVDVAGAALRRSSGDGGAVAFVDVGLAAVSEAFLDAEDAVALASLTTGDAALADGLIVPGEAAVGVAGLGAGSRASRVAGAESLLHWLLIRRIDADEAPGVSALAEAIAGLPLLALRPVEVPGGHLVTSCGVLVGEDVAPLDGGWT